MVDFVSHLFLIFLCYTARLSELARNLQKLPPAPFVWAISGAAIETRFDTLTISVRSGLLEAREGFSGSVLQVEVARFFVPYET